LDGRRNVGNSAVWHGLSLRKTILVRIVFLGSIAILFGGIVEEAGATLEVGGIVGGATGCSILSKKGLWHGKFRDKGVGDGLSIREGASWNVHVAGLLGNVARGGAPGIEAAIQSTKRGFFINRLGVSTGRIELSACGKHHIFWWHGSGNSWST
jgi:hypothetical protein